MGIVGSPVLSGGGGVSDAKDIAPIHPEGVIVSSLTDQERNSNIILCDSSAGGFSVTLPTLTAAEDGVIKILKDSSLSAFDNNVNITNTVEGEVTPGLYTDGAVFAVRWNGQNLNYEVWREEKNLFEYDAALNQLIAKEDIALVAAILRAASGNVEITISDQGFSLSNNGEIVASIDENGNLISKTGQVGQSADAQTTENGEFQNLEINTDDDGTSIGNVFSNGANLSSNIISNTTDGTLSNLGNAVDGSTSGTAWLDFRSKWGEFHQMQFSSPQKVTRITTNWYSDTFNYRGDSIKIEFSTNGINWIGTETIDTSGDLKGGQAANTNTHDLQNTASYEYMRYTVLGQGQEGVLMEIGLYDPSPITVFNTFESETLTSRTVTPSNCEFRNESGTAITQSGNLEVSWTTDGSNFGPFEDVATFLSRTNNIVSTGDFRFKLSPIGDTRVSEVDVGSPSSQFKANSGSMAYVVDGTIIFEVLADGSIPEIDKIYNGESRLSATPLTSPTTLTNEDKTILLDSSGGNFTITLPAVTSVNVGKEYEFKMVAGSNTVTIAGDGSETIDGAATNSTALTAQWDYLRLKNDGTQWLIL